MSKKYLTVSAITKYVKRILDTDPHLNDLWLKGEISNFNHHSRGHMYLTIKDEHSRIQAVMFAGNNRFLKFTPENGMHVLIRGNISVFEPFGQYQLYIKQMEPDGLGSLHLAFEQLKDKLDKKGYFDATIKKPIPTYPKHIGIITSPTGAAIRDIMTTLNRRYPIVNKTVFPVLVQGEGAAKSISQAIKLANMQHDLDVLIIGRGGGSIEDLWAFNEEVVATSIYTSHIPIVSAVGHETDFTISDFVADLRAPTPTAAAEITVPSRLEVNEKIAYLNKQLSRTVEAVIKHKQTQLKRLNESYGLRYTERLLEQKEQLLDRQNEKIKTSIKSILEKNTQRLQYINTRFQHNHPKSQLNHSFERIHHLKHQQKRQFSFIYQNKQKEFSSLIDKMTLLNPLEIMSRGFAIPYSTDHKIIKSSDDLTEQQPIELKFTDGTASCRVEEIRRD